MKRILIIGSLNMDMVVNVEHTPCVGETILGSKIELIPGGKGANQACAAGRLGMDVTMLGAIGKDSYGQSQKTSLKEAGVNIDYLIEREDDSTGIAFITVNKEGDNCIVVAPGANISITPSDIDRNRDLINLCDIVIFQMEIPIETVCYGAKVAKELGKTVILDPAPVPPEFPEELYKYLDVIKPNETELGMLTDMAITEENVKDAAEVIRSKGVKNVIVTLGEKGVYVNSENYGEHRIPCQKVDVVDTTAAGDSFTAALAAMILKGKDIKEAAEFANYVSALVVTRKGAQTSIPTMQEVMEYWNLQE